MGLQCSCRAGLCSSTLKPHRRLEGNAPGGRRWTLVAQPYPPPLVRLYTRLATRAHKCKAY
eukprot:1666678-Heterocapsa_arctica.AAC.1